MDEQPITGWRPSPRQQALIDTLATWPYPILTKAARTLGYSVNTVRKWNIDPQFQAALQQAYAAAEHETRANLSRRIQALTDTSVAALSAALTSENDAVRLRAAQTVIERVLGKATERHEVTGADGQAINVHHAYGLDMSTLSDDELRAIINGTHEGGSSRVSAAGGGQAPSD